MTINTQAVHKHAVRALQLVAEKHGIELDVTTEKRANSVVVSATLGQYVSPDARLLEAHQTPKMRHGHATLQRQFSALKDAMLGRRFQLDGKEFLYLGCVTSRPKYPVSLLKFSGAASYDTVKAPIAYLEAMIDQVGPQLLNEGAQMALEKANAYDPETGGGQF